MRYRPLAACAAFAVAWLAATHRPTTAQPPGEIDRRLQALEQKLDKLTELLEPRALTTRQILFQCVDRLQGDVARREEALAEFRSKHPLMAARDEGTLKQHVERQDRSERKRKEYRQELAELREKIQAAEKAAKADIRNPKVDKLLALIRDHKEQCEGLETLIKTLDDLVDKDDAAARELSKYLGRKKALQADAAKSRLALEAAEATLRAYDAPAK